MSRTNLRQWPRHEKQHQVQFLVSIKDGFSVSLASNFSRGGLCLTHGAPLVKGTMVMVRLNMALAGLARDVRATVKWCVPAKKGGYAIGLEYEHPLYWTLYK